MYGYHDGLYVCVLTQEQHERTCNYWYTVTSHCTAHTAFETKRGLVRWMKERGLKLTAPLTNPGEWSCQPIQGGYFSESHFNDSFDKIEPIITTRTVSNGDYVVAKITEDENGLRHVHTLNPNARRKVYNYRKSAKMMR